MAQLNRDYSAKTRGRNKPRNEFQEEKKERERPEERLLYNIVLRYRWCQNYEPTGLIGCDSFGSSSKKRYKCSLLSIF
jgi:hypothetical protein